MTSAYLWLSVSLCFICFHVADGYLFIRVNRCVFNSSELKDTQYIHSVYFNRDEIVRFDSRVGQWVGYTEHGVKKAEKWNKDATFMSHMRSRVDWYCKPDIKDVYSAVLDKTVEPYVNVTSATPHRGSRHTHMLVCSSYSFYPKHILVTWLRDGEPTTSVVSSTAELPDGDWYYQHHSYLEYTPRSGEKISCMVEHPSLMAPKVVDWDPSMPEADRTKMAVGASGLVLGVVLGLCEFIYYHRKKQGHAPVPTDQPDDL